MLLVRHRIAVIESVLRVLQSVEPERFQSIDEEMKGAASLKRSDPRRMALAKALRFRKRLGASVRQVIDSNRTVLDGLEAQFLSDHGVVGDGCDAYGKPFSGPSLSTLQLHLAPSVRSPGWRSTVFRCAARCQLAGSECVEPAVLACIQILRALRDLVEDDGVPEPDEAEVFDARGRLRTPARLFLQTVDQPMRSTLDEIASKAGRKEEYFRHVTGPLQNLGFVRLRSDGSWSRTAEGTQLLRS